VIEVRPDERQALRHLFLPDRPGPLTGLHAIQTGLGRVHADRWPEPRAAVAQAGEDVQLAGDAAALDAEDLRSLGLVRAMIDAPAPFVPPLESAFPGLWRWPRVVSKLEGATVAPPEGVEIRRLRWSDARAIGGLHRDLAWISNSWEGPEGLAGSGFAFGAFARGRLVSVATPFHMGERFEDIGVVTEAAFRRRGLVAACVARVVADMAERGRSPSWSTTPDNAGSLAVAAKFGACEPRDDVLYMVGWDAAP
jgi:hypothetical protein